MQHRDFLVCVESAQRLLEHLMQTSRLLISTLTALSVVGIAGYAVAQTSTTTTPGAITTTTPGVTTTVSPPSITTTTETEAERMTRERLARERMNAAAATDRMDQSTLDRAARRDADGNLIARADRN